MAEPFLGELRLVGFNFAPVGWALANGQLLSIAQNTALFSLLGTTYGGDGRTTFALPDLRGRVPMHQGQGVGLQPIIIGETLGSDSVTLAVSNLPAHSHLVNATSAKGNQPSPIGHIPATDAAGVTAEYSSSGSNGTMSANTIQNTGGGQAFDNHQPSLVLNWVIALEGIFPSRN
jgi:microcystin-dependent protein